MTAPTVPDQRAPRRRWPLSEKQRIVELTLREGASIRAIAREHGIDPTSLSHWRTRYRAGKLTPATSKRPARVRASNSPLLPVTISPLESRHFFESDARSVVHLTFSSGTSLRIENVAWDGASVCALVAQLQR